MTEPKTYQMLINGNWVDAGDGNTFQSINPTTGQVWAEVPDVAWI